MTNFTTELNEMIARHAHSLNYEPVMRELIFLNGRDSELASPVITYASCFKDTPPDFQKALDIAVANASLGKVQKEKFLSLCNDYQHVYEVLGLKKEWTASSQLPDTMLRELLAKSWLNFSQGTDVSTLSFFNESVTSFSEKLLCTEYPDQNLAFLLNHLNKFAHDTVIPMIAIHPFLFGTIGPILFFQFALPLLDFSVFKSFIASVHSYCVTETDKARKILAAAAKANGDTALVQVKERVANSSTATALVRISNNSRSPSAKIAPQNQVNYYIRPIFFGFTGFAFLNIFSHSALGSSVFSLTSSFAKNAFFPKKVESISHEFGQTLHFAFKGFVKGLFQIKK
jgi:hypothetical protein